MSRINNLNTIGRVQSLNDLLPNFDAILCDVWGVIHNGISPYPSAVQALVNARQRHKKVILVSNSPRLSSSMTGQLDEIGVAKESFDAVVTSGDVSLQLLAPYSKKLVYHLGPARNHHVFSHVPVQLCSSEKAEVIFCSGLFDDRVETPEDYRSELTRLARRGVPMICTNPDRKVEVGLKIIYCAGALADLYLELGGFVEFCGKPYHGIYQLALSRAGFGDIAGEGKEQDVVQRLLAIGDGLDTDVLGAIRLGIPLLYIHGSLHNHDARTRLCGNDLSLDLGNDTSNIIGWMASLT